MTSWFWDMYSFERIKTAERASKASRAEPANEWAVQENEWMDERVAQYLRRNSLLFWTAVQWTDQKDNCPIIFPKRVQDPELAHAKHVDGLRGGGKRREGKKWWENIEKRIVEVENKKNWEKKHVGLVIRKVWLGHELRWGKGRRKKMTREIGKEEERNRERD